MYRLQRWQYRAQIHASKDRNLYQAMSELSRLTDRLHVPSTVTETAAHIYRKALKKGLVRGRSINTVIAASLYMACRLTSLPRNLKSFTAVSPRTCKEISRCYRVLHKHLPFNVPIDEPCQYISQIASAVGLNQNIQNVAIQVIHSAQQHQVIVGKKPRGIAAAALYIAAKIQRTSITQADLAKAADVTEVTIRNQYKSLDHTLKLGIRKKRAPSTLIP